MNELDVRKVGDYSERVTPLPIPNRVVKHISADGTGFSGRVGRRHFSEAHSSNRVGFFYALNLGFMRYCSIID